MVDVQVLDVEPENTNPPEELEIIGNNPGQVTNISIEENSSVVVDVDSSLEGTGNVTYSILSAAGGSFAQDLAFFTINPTTGVLSFTNAPDFENPLDGDGNNVYQVDVVATSGNESVVQFIDVAVTDDPSDDFAIVGNSPGEVTNLSIIEVTSGGNTAIQFIDVTVLDVAETSFRSAALSFNQVTVNLAAETTYLVTDQNNNGIIDDRSELFGGAVGEGFADLASFEANNDGLVTALDDNFADLLIWQDANDNGLTDSNELISLPVAGIASVDTDFTDVFSSDALQSNILTELITDTGLTNLI